MQSYSVSLAVLHSIALQYYAINGIISESKLRLKMTYREAFDDTIKLFSLKASEIAERSGVGENQISRFRSGKSDLQASSLEKVINSLPDQARAYFYSRVMTSTHESHLVAA